MSVGTVAFFVFALFVIHEFEEIIRVVPWINRHSGDERFARDTWIARKKSYPSTEVVAAVIAEEIVLFGLILLVGIGLNSMPIILATATVNCIHLFMHFIFAIRVRAWNPGSVTAAITFPLNIIVIVLAANNGVNPMWWAILTIILAVVIFGNLRVLLMLSPVLQKRMEVASGSR